MDQLPEDDTIDFVDMSRLEIVASTIAVGDADSPLAHAIRRRNHEVDHPKPITAGHDSVI
jgi:hypothetical protein